MKEYEIKLRVHIDSDDPYTPDKWDWKDLLRIAENEYLAVLNVEEVGGEAQ